MPEERNRVIVSHLSDLHFCSSENAANNLKADKITENVYYVGDLMKDLLLKNLSSDSLCSEPYLFCTIHRNYNKNDPEKLKALLHKLSQLPKKIYFSVHPATLTLMADYGIDLKAYRNIIFLPPLSYNHSIAYQKGADAIITDSGGIQKEAYWLKKMCITIRKETEWIETLKGKWNQLLYGDLNSLPYLLNTIPAEEEYNAELYGNGQAGGNIRKILSKLI